MWFGAEARARLAALPVFVLVVPWQCSLVAPLEDEGRAAPSAVTAKQEGPPGRVSIAPPHTPPVRVVTLPEEVVVKAIGVGQTAFLRCWARAQRTDPMLISTKVRLHLELDESGKVTTIQSDTESPTLASCLAVVARQLPFPAPGKPAVVDLPLMFR
jgi:hypothetical protein